MVLSRWTYKVILVSLQNIVTVGDRALLDEALPCANQIDTGILQGKYNPGETCNFLSHSQSWRKTQPEKS